MMNMTASHDLSPWPPPAHDAAAELSGLSKDLHDTVNLAAGLAAGGRRVDMAGLDRSVGLLCAKALDLPPVEGRAACALLFSLLSQIDALGVALRAMDP